MAAATGSSSISGLAFLSDDERLSRTPYNGALFFTDYARRCIWVMPAGADGLPDVERAYPVRGPRPAGGRPMAARSS